MLLFYIYGNADSKAGDTRVCRSGCPWVRARGREGRGFLQRSSRVPAIQKELLKCVTESYQNLLERKES